MFLKGNGKDMKTWYCVCRIYYDNGSSTHSIVDAVKTNDKPKSSHQRTNRRDIYKDWFPSKGAAYNFIRQ